MKKILFFLILSLGLASCHKDLEETTIIDEVYTPPVIKVNGHIAGLVVNENGQGIVGATVRVGNQQKETGPGGYFIFRNIVLDANGTFVRVDQPGYFQASKRFFAKANQMNYTTLTLMAKQSSGQINTSSGGTVTLSSGASVALVANSVVNADGFPYAGNVQVAARWLDPTDPNLGEIMPGNLQGISRSTQEEVALASYGMLAVELTGSAGEKLNIRFGYLATLKFPIPASLRNSAPAEIPLWYFDETTGLWREDGRAVKQGDFYEGTVRHFSFWNCDAPFPLVNIDGRILIPNGNPMANATVRVTVAGSTLTCYGYTNAEGVFSGKVPANQPLVLTVTDYYCGGNLLEVNIGPFGSDASLGDLQASTTNAVYTTLTGSVVNCDSDPVTQGIVQICQGSNCQFAVVENDGSFEYTFGHCSITEVTVTAYDLDAALLGTPQTVSIGQQTDVNLGTLAACTTQITEFIRLNINGDEDLYPLPYYEGAPGSLQYIGAFAPSDSTYAMQLTFPVGAPGTYTGPGVSYWSYRLEPSYLTGQCQNPCSDMTVVVTEFGNFGEFIRGTFSGNVDFFDINQQLFPNLPVSGEFAIIRTQ
mgnify:CR=1 FL=1